MKTELEKYIQFAINNGYIFNDINKPSYLFNFDEKFSLTEEGLRDKRSFNLIETFTSEEFIVAVAHGLYDKNRNNKEHFIRIGDYTAKTYYETVSDEFLCTNRIVEILTITQAVAIRKGLLKEFIINLNI